MWVAQKTATTRASENLYKRRIRLFCRFAPMRLYYIVAFSRFSAEIENAGRCDGGDAALLLVLSISWPNRARFAARFQRRPDCAAI